MAAQKVCKSCKAIVEGSTCTQCGSTELAENFKGRMIILNTEQSEIAKNVKINKKGNYAIKIG